MIAALRRLLVLASLVAACGCDQSAALDRLSPGERGRIVQVRSGHVVVLENGLVVRLAGIEAPARAQPYGPQARDALAKQVLNQEAQLLYGGARRDRYDRALAHLRLIKGRRWVQEEMLKAGAARVRTWPDNRALAAEMLETEAQARTGEVGLWALPDYRVRLPSETKGAVGFQVVEGRVAKVARSGSRTWLDFAGGLLSVQVAQDDLAAFTDAGKSPETLMGRLIRVRGPISGGSMRLDHPESVELLKSR